MQKDTKKYQKLGKIFVSGKNRGEEPWRFCYVMTELHNAVDNIE